MPLLPDWTFKYYVYGYIILLLVAFISGLFSGCRAQPIEEKLLSFSASQPNPQLHYNLAASLRLTRFMQQMHPTTESLLQLASARVSQSFVSSS